jgi:hypothetical protein
VQAAAFPGQGQTEVQLVFAPRKVPHPVVETRVARSRTVQATDALEPGDSPPVSFFMISARFQTR